MTQERSLIEWLRHIQIEWGLKAEKLSALIHISESALSKFLDPESPESKTQATVPTGLENAPPLVQIYKNLSRTYPDPDQQVAWLFTPHKDFGNQKPIDVAAGSVENLFWIAYTLETQAHQAKSADRK